MQVSFSVPVGRCHAAKDCLDDFFSIMTMIILLIMMMMMMITRLEIMIILMTYDYIEDDCDDD